MGRNLHFTKRHSTLVILSINLPRGLTREVVLSFTRKSECLLISNNLDTFLERYSMNFIAFYCKLNTKKEDEYKQIFISNNQNLVLFLTACFIRRWISNVLDVFRLRYLIPSQSWQWVRPSFIFFLLRGICEMTAEIFIFILSQCAFSIATFCFVAFFFNYVFDTLFLFIALFFTAIFRSYFILFSLPVRWIFLSITLLVSFLSNRIEAFCSWLTGYRFLPQPVHQGAY